MAEKGRSPFSKCRRCEKKIVWGLNEQGKPIPMDPVPACYMVTGTDAQGQRFISRQPNVMVTHFATCPFASDFSGRNRGDVAPKVVGRGAGEMAHSPVPTGVGSEPHRGGSAPASPETGRGGPERHEPEGDGVGGAGGGVPAESRGIPE